MYQLVMMKVVIDDWYVGIIGRCTGLFKKKYTLSKIYFTKTTDAKAMSCVRMARKSLTVLISMI
jgi:hypothetical protein